MSNSDDVQTLYVQCNFHDATTQTTVKRARVKVTARTIQIEMYLARDATRYTLEQLTFSRLLRDVYNGDGWNLLALNGLLNVAFNKLVESRKAAT